MAIPLRTFGNTLTDLQSGTNAAQGLDYSRANAQDAINQARLEAFLRLRGQQATIQAQQNSLAQERAMRMAELAQQNQQFGTSEANRLTLADKVAASQLAVAKESKGGLDPRAFETILAFNQQGTDKEAAAQALSVQRQKLVKEIKAGQGNHSWNPFKDNSPDYTDWKEKFGTEPDAKAAILRLGALDAQAAPIGLIANDTTGGYDYRPFTPIVPGQLRGGAPPPQVQPPTTFSPGGSIPSAQPPVPAMLQGGDVTLGGVPLNNFVGSPPVDAFAPSTVPTPPNRTIRIDANGNAFYVQ
jgi:hypothetical protein